MDVGNVVIVPRQDPRHTSACALTDSAQLGRWPTTGNTNPSFPEKKIFLHNYLSVLKVDFKRYRVSFGCIKNVAIKKNLFLDVVWI
jgi:hypothetical protein